MKNTLKALINTVKKALDNKSSIEAGRNAYANSDGALIARSMKSNADIILFVGGIVEDLEKREKLYNKDALTLAADTGIFAGGSDLPENFREWYEIPADNYNQVVTLPADDLKAACISASKDDTRPVLTAFNINGAGYIEAVDGLRAYRKKITGINTAALDPDNKLLIPAAAANYFKNGDVTISNGEKWLKLEDAAGVTIYARKLAGAFINLDSIYTGKYSSKTAAAVTVKDIKGFTSVLKTTITSSDRRQGIVLRVKNNRLEYFIESMNVYGVIESEAANDTPNDYYIIFNPRYIMDALTQGGNIIYLPDSKQAPCYINDKSGDISALLLPIRDDGYNPFADHDREEAEKIAAEEAARIARKLEAAKEAAAAAAEIAPAENAEAPAKNNYFRVSDTLTAGMTEEEKEALKRINDRQNAAGRFENITAEDVKKEAEAIAAEKAAAAQEQEAPATDPETEEATEAAPETTAEISEQVTEKLEIVKREKITPEIREARELYRRLKKCGFTPNEYQEADALIIYKNNRELLKPLARAAGGLYIDTLSIIAAIMTIGDKLN